MRIATYNIQYGLGRDGRYDLDRIVTAIRDADLIGLQEVERFADRSGDIDQAAAIGAALPEHYWVYGPTVDIRKALPPRGGRVENRRRQFGNMILSRWPILASRNLMLPRWAAAGPMTIQRGALEGLVETPAGPLRFYSTHLCHLSSRTRQAQAAFILETHRRAPLEGGVLSGVNKDPAWHEGGHLPPIPQEAVLVGDFNMRPDSPEYALIAGERSPRGGRLPGLDGFVDAWTAAGHDEETGVTHPGSGGRIDYVFVTPGLTGRVDTAMVDTDAAGSDHQPVTVALR